MQNTTSEQERRALAEMVRRACLAAAVDAYEQAREDGLCAEGAWEASLDAVRSLDLAPLLLPGGGAAADGPKLPRN